MSLGVLAYYERRVTSPAALSQLSMSGTRIGEVLLASTYESATYFCLLQVTVQSLESANEISLREVISSVDTCFTPIMIQNRRKYPIRWLSSSKQWWAPCGTRKSHVFLGRMRQKMSLRWAEERERTLSHIDDAVNPSRVFLLNFSGPRSTTTYSCCSSPSSVNRGRSPWRSEHPNI